MSGLSLLSLFPISRSLGSIGMLGLSIQSLCLLSLILLQLMGELVLVPIVVFVRRLAGKNI